MKKRKYTLREFMYGGKTKKLPKAQTGINLGYDPSGIQIGGPSRGGGLNPFAVHTFQDIYNTPSWDPATGRINNVPQIDNLGSNQILSTNMPSFQSIPDVQSTIDLMRIKYPNAPASRSGSGSSAPKTLGDKYPWMGSRRRALQLNPTLENVNFLSDKNTKATPGASRVDNGTEEEGSAKKIDWGDLTNRYIGDAGALVNTWLNKKAIDEMPISQSYITPRPVFEDTTRRDAQAINDIRRSQRAATLAGQQSGNAARAGNFASVAAAGAQENIGRTRTMEDLRLDQVHARNAARATRADEMSVGIFNQEMGNRQQNTFLQQQMKVDNRNALTQSLIGNQFQRANQDLERERMALIAARDNHRGTLMRLLQEELSKGEGGNQTIIDIVQNALNT